MKVVSLVLLLAGCAYPEPNRHEIRSVPIVSSSADAVALAEQSGDAPLVDHHQHLLSPAGIELENRPLLPKVDLPPDLAQLLSLRAEHTADAERLSVLFADDALLLGPTGKGGWIRGGLEAAKFISIQFAPGYRLTPVSFTDRGNTAEIAGYYSRGSGPTLRHPGYFSMSVVKDDGGAWRIAAETPVFPGPPKYEVIDAEALVKMLDEANIRRAVVLSNAYWFDGVIEHSRDPYQMVRAENDWTADQVARFPGRLVAFCSFSPLAEYAIEELERCSKRPEFAGLKLHLGTTGVDLKNPEHAARIQRVVTAADRLGFPILVHLTASPDYGREHAEIFLQQILPAAPNVPVVIAHLWGGAGYSDAALGVYADAVSAGDPRTKNLYFEVAQASLVEGRNPDNLQKIASRMRQIGFDRILYGSDGAMFGGAPPREVWADFRSKIPLSDEEFQMIATNVLPIIR